MTEMNVSQLAVTLPVAESCRREATHQRSNCRVESGLRAAASGAVQNRCRSAQRRIASGGCTLHESLEGSSRMSHAKQQVRMRQHLRMSTRRGGTIVAMARRYDTAVIVILATHDTYTVYGKDCSAFPVRLDLLPLDSMSKVITTSVVRAGDPNEKHTPETSRTA